MSDTNPTLQDVWRLLGAMNKRFDGIERQMVALATQQASANAVLRADLTAGLSSLKASIEARDFRLDDHGRRITDLETS